MADQSFTVADYGTNQQEAVGMGAVYDSRFEGASVQAFIPVSDTGAGVDTIASLLVDMTVADLGVGTETVSATASLVVLDLGNGVEGAIIAANIPVPETGQGTEGMSLSAGIQVAESGTGTGFVSPAKACYFVTSEGVLNPLGVIVLRDSRHDLLPKTRENTDAVPGRHGEIDFGSEFRPRILELHVASNGEFDRSQREQIKRTLAKWLNPILGSRNLIFADDIEKTYKVKYAGRIELSKIFGNWLEFTIPFKAYDPFIIGSFEKQHVGSGTLTNEGTFETPLRIEITGPATNPSVQIGSETLTWTGTVGESDTLVIDTEYMTVKFNGVNAIANYSGSFPKLQPGETAVTAASGGTTVFRWRDRWI